MTELRTLGRTRPKRRRTTLGNTEIDPENLLLKQQKPKRKYTRRLKIVPTTPNKMSKATTSTSTPAKDGNIKLESSSQVAHSDQTETTEKSKITSDTSNDQKLSKRRSSVKDKVDNLKNCIEAIVSNITAKKEQEVGNLLISQEAPSEQSSIDEKNFIKLEERDFSKSNSTSENEEGLEDASDVDYKPPRRNSEKKTKKERKKKTGVPKIKKKKEPTDNETKIKKKEPVENESETNETIYCDICDVTFKNSLEFVLHSIEHSDNDKYSCHICEFQTSLRYSIVSHVKSHKQKPSYSCEMCNKKFNVRAYAEEHKYFHTGEKPFQCEVCGKDFMFSRFLQWHRRTHHWENLTGSPLVKYDCLICNKHYLTSKGLALHKQKYHMEGFDQSKLCDICGKRLANIDKLKFHIRIHTGYKPHSCAICSKSFTRKELLREHERVHTGERPFKCNFCDKGFTQRAPLKIHRRLHTGEKPYVCLVCNRGFISKGAVDVHMKKCDGVKEEI